MEQITTTELNGKQTNETTIPVANCKHATSMHIEEALRLTKFGTFNYLLIFVSGVIMAMLLLETLGIGYAMPVAACDLGLTTSRKGILGAIGFAGIICSSHLCGFLADTLGRRKVIVPTLIMSFVCTCLSSVTTTYWIFVVLRFFNGFFLAGSSSGIIYAYLGEFHSLERRSRALSAAAVVFGTTSMFLPLNAWVVINQNWEFYIPYIDVVYKPWRLFMVTTGLPGFMGALAMLFFPESPKFVLSSQRNQAKTIAILQRMHRINNGISATTLEISTIHDEDEKNSLISDNGNSKRGVFHMLQMGWTHTKTIFMPPYALKTIIACILQFCSTLISYGLFIWYPEIMNRIADFQHIYPDQRNSLCEILDATKANYSVTSNSTEVNCITQLDITTSVYTIALDAVYLAGFIVIGLTVKITGEVPIISSIVIFCGVLGILAALVNGPLLISLLLFGLFSCGIVIPTVNTVTINSFPTTIRAMAICIAVMMGRFGGIVGTNLFALLIENYCDLCFVVSSAALIASGILALFLRASKT